jgi:hypothetical protein
MWQTKGEIAFCCQKMPLFIVVLSSSYWRSCARMRSKALKLRKVYWLFWHKKKLKICFEKYRPMSHYPASR